jgi:hypothetical protein
MKKKSPKKEERVKKDLSLKFFKTLKVNETLTGVRNPKQVWKL